MIQRSHEEMADGVPQGARRPADQTRCILGDEGRDDRAHGPGGSDAYPAFEHLEARPFEQALLSEMREVLEVGGIAVERLKERRADVREPRGLHHAKQLAGGVVGILEMLEHRLAMHSGDAAVRERQTMRVADHIDILIRPDVEIRDAGVRAGRAAAQAQNDALPAHGEHPALGGAAHGRSVICARGTCHK